VIQRRVLQCPRGVKGGTSCAIVASWRRYDEYADEMPIRTEPWEGEALGTVSANEAGAIWSDCTKSAEGTLWVLMAEAEKLGGNAIGDIRWIPNKERKGNREDPTCKKGWGWFLVWPVLVTPAFMSSRAQAQAYRIPESATPRAGLYRIPDSTEERAALIDRLLAGSSRRATL
jgi:hypothetical protein